MIRDTKQQWQAGQQVRVGFLTLTVRVAVPTPGDGLPDAYILVNAAGTQLYRFVPHRGVEKLDIDEASEMLAQARALEGRRATAAREKVQTDAGAVIAINAPFAA